MRLQASLRLRAALAAALSLALLSPWSGAHLSGQEIRTEVQIPVDADGRILEVSPELRRSLGLFPDLPGYRWARLFRGDDGSVVLEVAYTRDGALARDRRVLGEAQLSEWRRDLTERLAALGRRADFTREGRGGLLLVETLMGLGFYGWAIPAALDLDDSRTIVATYLLTAGASFFVPYQLTRRASVSDAHRNLTAWAATRGAFAGGVLGDLLADPDGNSDDRFRLQVGAAVPVSVVASLLAFKAVDRSDPSLGAVDLWGAMGDFGLALGLGSAYATGLYDEEMELRGDLPSFHRPDRRLGDAVGLVGAGAGLLAGRWLGRRESYTQGDALILRGAGLLGAHLALPVVNAFGADDGKPHAAGALVGMAAGIIVGNRLQRNRSLSRGDGLLVEAGQIAGGLAGLGLVYVLDDDGGDELPYLAVSALGAAAGYAFTLRAIPTDGGPLEGRSGAGAGRAPVERGGVQVSLNPTALLAGLAPASRHGREVRIPLVSVRFD